MSTTAERLLDLTAGDVIKRELVTIPQSMSIRGAAKILRRAKVSAAPVVDEMGRFVGVLSAFDILDWVEEGCLDAVAGSPRACPYQTEGRLLTGGDAIFCTLSPGCCPLQSMQSSTAGRQVAICTQPLSVHCEWQQLSEVVPTGLVSRYMTTKNITAKPETPLADVARLMVDASLRRVFIVDEKNRPIGVVNSTDILAAMGLEWQQSVEPMRKSPPGD